MAKKVNRKSFDDRELDTTAALEYARSIEKQAREFGKEANKKTHVSVLLDAEDFKYVKNYCFENDISKNEFFKRLLNDFRDKSNT